MKLTIIPSDNMVMIDSYALIFSFPELEVLQGVHAVQWDDTKGHIEYVDPVKPNDIIETIKDFQPIVDAYNAERARLDQIELDKISNRTYQEKRALEYPPIGDQLDALWKLVDVSISPEAKSIKDSIDEIKAKYPEQ
jgi:hypothetical protein